MYYKVQIQETASSNLKEKKTAFNCITETFGKLWAVKEFLKERYGKEIKKKPNVFMDNKEGKSIPIGYTVSFWNSDISHNSSKWHQTDWIQITAVKEKPILLNNPSL
jgi:hypothetical protein